ncbi:APC family permease [Sulfurivirga sp.]|uniref:APC family permease n=1 Tax=Sulfurivirga sp. TaxID=2614236 RepID=UPI0025DA0C6F|nr:APC family permease [Sulfurivirga sp.]
MQNHSKAFGAVSAAMLGVGAMVGAGIFIVIGQAGAIAGNLVWVSFVLGGLLALASGYSLAKLALRWPSRGGLVEYLTQLFGEGPFSGTGGVLFYLAQVIAMAAVAKAFGSYGSQLFGLDHGFENLLAVGIVLLFALINTLGASWVSRSENLIVAVKLTILVVFTGLALVNIDPSRLALSQAPPAMGILYAVGLTFFAYQGFSLICNTVEDMDNPQRNMPRAILLAIGLVAALYVAVSVAVLGNLSLDEVIKAQDYALAEAARPFLGDLGFRIMAVAALISTASAINATLYAATEITYVLIREGALPALYRFHRFESMEALWITTGLTIPLILLFDLSGITLLAALSVLVLQGLVHFGHIFHTDRTGARRLPVALAAAGMFIVAWLTIDWSHKEHPWLAAQLLGLFALAFAAEMTLYHLTGRTLRKQTA